MAEAMAEKAQEDEQTYSGLVSAFPYALRASDSWLFKCYVLVGGFVAAVVTLLFTFSLVVLIAATTGGPGGTFTVSRAFFIVVGLLVVAPILAPVLLVARRHRRVRGERSYDAALALAGYLLLCSLYVGVVISIPAEQQIAPAGTLAPVITFLYALPALAGLVPPIVAVGVMFVAHKVGSRGAE